MPVKVEAAIEKAVRTVPADRFTRARDFAAALTNADFRYGEATSKAMPGLACEGPPGGVAITSNEDDVPSRDDLDISRSVAPRLAATGYAILLGLVGCGERAPEVGTPAEASPSEIRITIGGTVTAEDGTTLADPAGLELGDTEAEQLLQVESGRLATYLDGYGVSAALDALARAGTRLGRDCHQQAHRLGRAAYERFGGSVLTLVGHECHSGALHGATEAMFRDRGTLLLETDVEAMCGEALNRFYRHQCLHGIGHGLLAWTEYELHDALDLCDQPTQQADRDSCYSGVFMENVVGGLTGSADRNTDYLSPDPHYPCNAVDGRRVSICYFYQTSRMIELFRGDFGEVARVCSEAPPSAMSYCFLSMGRDVSARTRGRPREAMRHCAEVQESYHRILCLEGAVQDAFWGPSGADDAILFCRALGDRAQKNACYATIIARAREVLSTAAELRAFCEAVEEPWRDRCAAV